MRSVIQPVAIAAVVVAVLLTLSPAGHAQDRYAPGELLVRFAPETSEAEIETINRDTGCEVIRLIEFIDVYWLKITSGLPVDAAVEAYSANERVEFAEPNYVRRPAGREPNNAELWPNDPTFNSTSTWFGRQWSLDNWGQTGGIVDADIDAPQMWRMITAAADTIIVAIMDTGIDLDHPDLAANLWTNAGEIAGNNLDDDSNGYIDDVHGYDFVQPDPDGDPNDIDGHGTHVAGIVGAVGNNGEGIAGIAWSVQLMALRILPGGVAEECLAIDYARQMKAKIINMSFEGDEFSQAEENAIERARQDRILVVAAAGNGNRDVDVQPVYPACYAGSNIISVAASTRNDQRRSTSNWGALNVDLAAPGSDIFSTVIDTYDFKSGTSMAAPHVTGAAALCWSLEPSLTLYDIKDHLLDHALSFNDAAKEKKPAFKLDGATPVRTEGRLRAAQNADFGDAPDDPYPTRWPPTDWGAIHLDCGLEWIGADVSLERSATDWDGTDTDGRANLSPHNNDGFDDGVVFHYPYHCKGPYVYDQVDVVLTVSNPDTHRYGRGRYLYLNSFFDFNDNGSWADMSTCVTPGDAPDHLLIQMVGGDGAPSVVNLDELPCDSLVIDPSLWLAPAGERASRCFELYFYSPPEYEIAPQMWTRFRVEYDDRVWPTPDSKYIGTEFTYSLFGEVEDHRLTSASPVDSLPEQPEQPLPPPATFRLGQNSPNPFNPFTLIAYDLPVDCRVRLDIYDAQGRRVKTLVDDHQTAGRKSVLWNSTDSEGYRVTSGTYFYRIQAGEYTQTRKMVLLK